MILRVLSSGSKGNCYVLTDSNGKRLILDVGIQYKKILNGIDFDLDSVIGVCVTHEHKDHSLSANEFIVRGVPIYRPYAYEPNARLKADFGDFHVQCFPLEHDVVCYGFLITHPEMGKLVYITDTAYCKFRFKELNHILIECNYDAELLADDYAAHAHVVHDHMSLETMLRFIEANQSESLRNVIACHLSETNISEPKLVERLKTTIDSETKISVAHPGVEVECMKEC